MLTPVKTPTGEIWVNWKNVDQLSLTNMQSQITYSTGHTEKVLLPLGDYTLVESLHKQGFKPVNIPDCQFWVNTAAILKVYSSPESTTIQLRGSYIYLGKTADDDLTRLVKTMNDVL